MKNISKLNCFDLKIEYLTEPIGMDERHPRFFWKIDSGTQSAWQIEVENVINTGKVLGSESIQVIIPNLILQPKHVYRWRVRIWDENDCPCAWSSWNSFETGLFGEFPGEWIRSSITGTDSQPCAYFRSLFYLDKQPHKARLFMTALGMYEPSLNGSAITENCFLPGWTDYYHRVQYQLFDITHLLHLGENVLGVILNEGWFSGKITRQWTLGRIMYGETPAFKALLEVDGGAIPLEWRYNINGPIRCSDLYLGENYDARMELPGWNQTGYTENGDWYPSLTCSHSIRYDWTSAPPVIRADFLKPVSIRNLCGELIIDFGQNHAGREHIVLHNAPRGREIIIRHGEMLDNDSRVYTISNRGARATTIYITKGGEHEVIEPHFTYYGYRYISISSADDLELEIESVVIHTEMERTGFFNCSDERINQLYSNTLWGEFSNYVDIPTDCPQRDEKLGWTGDAQVFIGTAAYHTGIGAFFSKFLTDLELCCNECGVCPQFIPFYRKNDFIGTAGWADAKLICPEILFQMYGDRRLMEKSYKSTIRYLHYVYENECIDNITSNAIWGDHMAICATDKSLIATAFFANALHLGSKFAERLGDLKTQNELLAIRQRVRIAWQERFLDADGRLINDTEGALLLALQFDMVEQKHIARLVEQLRENIERNQWHLTTGFLTTSFLMPVLLSHGLEETAYRLLKQEDMPSWLFPVMQGATTIWERWNAWSRKRGFDYKNMTNYGSSFNHYAFGAVAQSFYEWVCGIRPDPERPGFKHFFLDPHPGKHGFKFAKSEYRSVYGTIKSEWMREDDGILFAFSVPPNTTATVLPEMLLLTPGEYTLFRYKNGRYVFDLK